MDSFPTLSQHPVHRSSNGEPTAWDPLTLSVLLPDGSEFVARCQLGHARLPTPGELPTSLTWTSNTLCKKTTRVNKPTCAGPSPESIPQPPKHINGRASRGAVRQLRVVEPFNCSDQIAGTSFPAAYLWTFSGGLEKYSAASGVCCVLGEKGFREKTMARSALAVLLVAAAVVLMASVETAQGAISCNQVTSALVPCASYILGGGAKPTAQCCNGVRALNAAVKSTPDRRTACGCLKSAAASYGVNYGKSSKIPGLCGVKLGVPISASVDCSKVR